MTGVSAASLGLAGCHDCGTVARPTGLGDACPRCGATLHLRKSDSLARAWALVIASYILYVPANLLPIMETSSLFGAQRDTILSGIVFLWHSGSWDLALIVFVASVVVPLSKHFALTYLLVSVRRGSTSQPLQKAKLYRMVEFVGKWSMLDIYRRAARDRRPSDVPTSSASWHSRCPRIRARAIGRCTRRDMPRRRSTAT